MSGSVESKDDHVFMAKLSEQAERYQGVIKESSGT